MPRRPLPSINRVDFYRLKEDELICALAQATRDYLGQYPDQELTANHEAVVAWAQMSIDVPNGGFIQYFFNHRGDAGVAQLAKLFDSIDFSKVADLLRDAAIVFHRHQSAFAVDNPWDGLFGSIQAFERYDQAFMNVLLRGNRGLEKWIRAHIHSLAIDELGNPIDAQFTGSVETMQPNGLVSEYLEVKKGKPNGAYREFFDDGTVRKVIFYRSGKVTGDFWPDGQLKRKESRRGPLTIIEWFHPTGSLQKRYVKDKSGHAVEPIRLYHENGQLAEELHTVDGEKCGPWLKFFTDGSPRLHAEYTTDGNLLVRDAWDANGNQAVKDGTGVFEDDSRSINWMYDVYIDLGWPERRELKDGILHGKVTRYSRGVLWSVSNFVNGVLDGESITYWDNGRIRSITNWVRGKEDASRSYPKFDRPVPRVVLSIEASERLYTAWGHIRVDEYPQLLNLDEVQGRLNVPDFLQEVYERNLAGCLKSEYEDWNTFDDGIAYVLKVNEAGEVVSATANGSGVYSGGEWGTYPPLLRTLRFNAGRIRGRPVECLVLARVDHTFVESGTEECGDKQTGNH